MGDHPWLGRSFLFAFALPGWLPVPDLCFLLPSSRPRNLAVCGMKRSSGVDSGVDP